MTACTQPLPDEDAEQFGVAATRATSVVGLPNQAQSRMWRETQENQRLCTHLRGGAIDLDQVDGKPPVTDLARQQAEAGAALSAYAKALADAMNGGSVAELAAAQEQFDTAFGAFATATGTAANDQAAIGSAFELVRRIGEGDRQRRIRQIMRDAIDPLFLLQDLLEQDVSQVVGETERFLADWDRAAECVLRASRQRSEGPAMLAELTATRAELAGQMRLIRQAPEPVDALKRLHVEVVTDTKSLAEALPELVGLLTIVDELTTQLTGEDL